MAAAWILSSLFFASPEENRETAKAGMGEAQSTCRQYTSGGKCFVPKQFYFLLATMLFGLISYFMISPISQSYEARFQRYTAAIDFPIMIG